MIEPWRVERTSYSYRDRWLTVRSDDCRTASGRPVAPFHVLELPTWLNVVALTAEGRIVLVTEYRHGTGEILTGLPSGAMEPDDPDPEAAARRELLEETGHGGGTFVSLGRFPANPANQTNDVCCFLAVGVAELAPQRLDPSEEILVTTEPFADWLSRLGCPEVRVQVSHVAAAMLAARVIAEGRFPELSEFQGRLDRSGGAG
ncbi:NUDIX hydrolase [Tautonia sociabilis]|uniref:NUDIX hydrolase n=1 Tax=Tautonia sociabilis TaxID=2080755 RepID=A0A432MM25_9BACT|nr:NUDIX hydrolase [Tautonia sociabilis]RUL88471.1 NUDIX hydrolase [Tautonia sociabilis]